MARIDAYAYYLSTYSNNRPSRFDAHKKSNLREIYHKMVKTNREAPLYKLSNEDSVAKYAIDIKESAKSIQNVVASLSDSYGEFQDSFQKKVAVSSDEASVSVKYVGDGTEDARITGFDIEVKKLSSPQVNQGRFLKNDGKDISSGSYSFDLTTDNSTYEFHFTVNQGEKNIDVLKKLAGLVNRSSLGIHATIRHGASDSDLADSSALTLTSRQTGRETEENIFEIAPGANFASIRALETLGIHNITNPAENSVFLFNGATLNSASNTFTINDSFEVTLNQISPDGKPAEIRYKNDIDAVVDNISTLVDAFNGILDIAEDTSEDATGDINKLLNEMSSISKSRRESLGEIGLEVGHHGRLSINKDTLQEAISPERSEDTFYRLSHFKSAIGAKADAVAINPMNYVNKVVVNYKNPARALTAPYFTSVYSGMMLDRYI